jgi:hypothetical protein
LLAKALLGQRVREGVRVRLEASAQLGRQAPAEATAPTAKASLDQQARAVLLAAPALLGAPGRPARLVLPEKA